MASFAAFLEVGGKRYPLYRYELSMHQETDTLGRPASPVLGGTIICVLSSPGQQDSFLYQWMLSPVMQHDGLIRLTDPTSGATLKTISFFNAYCTNMDLTFMPGRQGGGGSSLIQLQISPQRVAVGAITHDNNWPLPSHGSGQSFVKQEQPHPKPKPKPGIVVGPPPVGLPRIPPTTPPGTPPRVPPKLPQIPRNVPKIPLPHPVLVFLAALFGWHDAGVANEWEQKLPKEDEQRYRELEAKRSREIAQGGKLSPQEEAEYQSLDKRKYPYGRGGTSRGSHPKTSKEGYQYDYEGVEIVDDRGSPIGELDGVDMDKKAIIEDKSAKGINRVNPKTGLPNQTPEQWATKQLVDKTNKRIDSLQRAAKTRPTGGGSPTVPGLGQLQDIRKIHFVIDNDDPEVVDAAKNAVEKLRQQHPDWEFSVEFGN